MKVTVIGTGFVGVVSAAVFASFGHEVIGLDIDAQKIERLNQSEVPFFEPNLRELLTEQLQSGNLRFTTDYSTAVPASQVVLVSVGTPSAPDGTADLKFVLAATESLAPHLSQGVVVVIKSTVPPGTLEVVRQTITNVRQAQNLPDVEYYLASVPEFLREGSAVYDTQHPDRVVLGVTDDAAFETLSELHRPLDAPIVRTTPESAQMAKYAANAYLATRITFINQVADLCQKNGANVDEVIEAIGHDQRIGSHYWYPGFGYGGSCFPKDVKELAAYSKSVGEGDNLFNKVNQLNQERIPRLMKNFEVAVGGWSGKTVALLGLAFKPNTDDMREAPSLSLIPLLLKSGATVKAYDPKAIPVAASFIKPDVLPFPENLSYHQEISEACQDADVIMAVIEWPQVVSFEFSQVRDVSKTQWFIDGRNQFDAATLQAAGYHYLAVGKS